MDYPQNRHIRHGLFAVLAMAAGWWTGVYLRQNPGRDDDSKTPDSVVRRSNLRVEAANSGKTRPDTKRLRDSPGIISFSLFQWSRLLCSPRTVRVALPDCLPNLEVPIVNDVPLIGRLFQERKIDLSGPAGFFGWDERTVTELQSVLGGVGRELSRIETQGVRISYPDSGGLMFDFSQCAHQREAVIDKLKARLAEVLGPQDAERFAIISRMEGLSTPLVDSGRFLPEVVFTDPDLEPGDLTPANHDPEPELAPRHRHLRLKIDWNQMKPVQ